MGESVNRVKGSSRRVRIRPASSAETFIQACSTAPRGLAWRKGYAKYELHKYMCRYLAVLSTLGIEIAYLINGKSYFPSPLLGYHYVEISL